MMERERHLQIQEGVNLALKLRALCCNHQAGSAGLGQVRLGIITPKP